MFFSDGCFFCVTPIQRIREEKKEERRRRELERKRLRDEERRKWRDEERRKRKEAEKMKRLDKPLEKDKEQAKEEPKIKVIWDEVTFLFNVYRIEGNVMLFFFLQLLKKTDRADDTDPEKPKEKVKKTEKHNKEERCSGGLDHKRRQSGENKEERVRK